MVTNPHQPQINYPDGADEDLLLKIQRADSDAFAVLVKRHSERFYALAYRMLASKVEAEDIVQSAFVKLWQSPEKWDPVKQAKFTTWFYRVVTNACLDFKRKKQPANLIEEAIAGTGIDLDEILDQQTLNQKLETLIQGLPERQALALNLCFYEGLSNKEAAEVMEIGVKALESLLMRAKSKLKSMINDKEASSAGR